MPGRPGRRCLFRIACCPDDAEVQRVAGLTKFNWAIQHLPPCRDPKGSPDPRLKERKVVAGPEA